MLKWEYKRPWRKRAGRTPAPSAGRTPAGANLNRPKEIKMSTNRLFNLSILVVLMAFAGFAIRQVVVTTVALPGSNYTIDPNAQAIHEYQLGERYGEIPSH